MGGRAMVVELQRDPDHVDLGDLVEIERHSAPAAADVEDALARLEMQLGRDMRLLVRLRLFEAVGGIREIGAAVLHVGIEERLVQLVAQVVVMGDIAARSARVVAADERLQLLEPALAEQLAAAAPFFPRVRASDHLEQVENGPVLDGQPASRNATVPARKSTRWLTWPPPSTMRCAVTPMSG